RLLSVGTRAGFAVRSLRLAAPTAGATFVGGTSIRLSWEVYATPRVVASIAVERSEDAGATWSRIATLAAAARARTWPSPVVAAERSQRLRIVLRDAGGVAISSAAVAFVLTPAAP
ncbi:MAG TPA: hypothetical protein VN317_02575, partial [Candidatus Methanoperedens sp.]|nr:hypothetical protein [Candidatus Methanoperedens sp.]